MMNHSDYNMLKEAPICVVNDSYQGRRAGSSCYRAIFEKFLNSTDDAWEIRNKNCETTYSLISSISQARTKYARGKILIRRWPYGGSAMLRNKHVYIIKRKEAD